MLSRSPEAGCCHCLDSPDATCLGVVLKKSARGRLTVMHEHMIPDGHQAYKHCSASGRAADVIARRTTISKADNSVLACEVKVDCCSGLGIFKKLLKSSATSISLFKSEDQEKVQGGASGSGA